MANGQRYIHRIIMAVPLARITAVSGWFAANIGADAIDLPASPGLSPTGLAPATHRWISGAWTDAEARAILRQICILASVTPPTLAQWNGWTGPEKRTWLAGVREALFSGYGVWVILADNGGDWGRAEDALDRLGLQRVVATGGP